MSTLKISSLAGRIAGDAPTFTDGLIVPSGRSIDGAGGLVLSGIATLSGGSGDAAIYANPNGWASESDYYWTARNSSGNQEQIDVTHPSTENYIYFYLNGEFQDAEFKVQLIQN